MAWSFQNLTDHLKSVKVTLDSLGILLSQLPIVTDGISSREPQTLLQHHTKAFIECIATYHFCMYDNIQNIQTIIWPCQM